MTADASGGPPNNTSKGLSNDEKEYVITLLGEYGSYETHKESMAYAAILLQVGLLSYIFTAENWPPKWADHCGNSICPLLVILSILWLMIYGFLRFQLWGKRVAAIRSGALMRLLGKWVKGEKIPRVAPSNGEPQCLFTRCDFWFPRRQIAPSDIDDALPPFLRAAEEEQREQGTGALCEDWLLTGGSVVLLLSSIVVTLLRSCTGT